MVATGITQATTRNEKKINNGCVNNYYSSLCSCCSFFVSLYSTMKEVRRPMPMPAAMMSQK